jgi:hypothetical protein
MSVRDEDDDPDDAASVDSDATIDRRTFIQKDKIVDDISTIHMMKLLISQRSGSAWPADVDASVRNLLLFYLCNMSKELLNLLL